MPNFKGKDMVKKLNTGLMDANMTKEATKMPKLKVNLLDVVKEKLNISPTNSKPKTRNPLMPSSGKCNMDARSPPEVDNDTKKTKHSNTPEMPSEGTVSP